MHSIIETYSIVYIYRYVYIYIYKYISIYNIYMYIYICIYKYMTIYAYPNIQTSSYLLRSLTHINPPRFLSAQQSRPAGILYVWAIIGWCCFLGRGTKTLWLANFQQKTTSYDSGVAFQVATAQVETSTTNWWSERWEVVCHERPMAA